jgi:hypothetical protein
VGIFSAKGIAKMYGKGAMKKRRTRRVKSKIKMPITYVKGSCFETPLYFHVLGNKRTVIRTNYEKRGRS